MGTTTVYQDDSVAAFECDWRSSLQFSTASSSSGFPIELFIKVMEEEAAEHKWNDAELTEQACSHMDCLVENDKQKLYHLKDWTSMKKYLLTVYGQEPTVWSKVQLLRSLTKAPDEKFQHFLTRVKHTVDGQMRLGQMCGCEKNTAPVRELEKLLFLAGLQDFELDLCDDFDDQILSNLELLVDKLSSDIKDDPDPFLPSFDVKPESEAVMKEDDGVDIKVDPDFLPESPEAEDEPVQPSEFDDSEDEEFVIPKKKKKLAKKPKSDLEKPARKNHSGPATCDHCDLKFRTKGELSKHMSSEHKKASSRGTKVMQICQLCKQQFTKSGIERHYFEAHKGMAVKCDTCGNLFTSAVKLRRHVENIHKSDRYKALEKRVSLGEVYIETNPKQVPPLTPLEPIVENFKDGTKKSVYKCALCPSSIESVQEYSKHCSKHHGGRRCKCDSCDFTAKDVMNVLEHRLKIHNHAWGNKAVYHCKINDCGLKTYCPFTLSDHIDVKHEKLQVQNCQVCSKVFTSKGALKSHIQSVHMGIKQFKCDQCDYQCNGKKALEIHKNVHLAEEEKEKFICDECGSGYSTLIQLKRHNRRVHQKERNCECPHCPPGKKFFQYSEMLAHMREVHQIDKKYVCSHCDRGFKSNHGKRVHEEAVHLKIKHYRCKLCNTLTANAYNLTYHIAMRHLGLKKSEVKANWHLAKNHDAFEFLGSDKKEATTG